MRARRAGLRLWPTDVLFLFVCIAVVLLFGEELLEFRWLPLVAAAHFFLFCNVFRVRRSYELVWAALFCVNFMLHVQDASLDWSSVLLWQAPVTVIAIALEMRSARYHGVFAERINSQHLQDWVEGRLR